ncbi:MAG: hypothetical protein K6F50_00345 [Kiritimatiellae bacterium]|nr:hypothetical protein [Kiritimatiellia bacterium]
MKNDFRVGLYVSFCLMSAFMLIGFMLLAVRLQPGKLGESVGLASERQPRRYSRVVRTGGLRGRILDRNGSPLAENVLSLVVKADPGAFRPKKSGETVEANMVAAVFALEPVIGRPSLCGSGEDALAYFSAQLKRDQVKPVDVWRNLSEEELARFCEHSCEHQGFVCRPESERRYPCGSLAAHVIGSVRRDDVPPAADSRRVSYREKELRGREGMEYQYDSYLRSVPGEDRLTVDVRGRTISRETLVPAGPGCDLRLTLDIPLQRAVEAQLDGCLGACVAIDPRDGAILACASAPSYDLNDFVPVLTSAVYDRLRNDPAKPLLNRATAGTYPPGSTFKPVTALAGLESGWPRESTYLCSGAYELGGMRIRCGRTWGHGPENVIHALRDSCNPFFCNLGQKAGTNAVMTAARKFGLGERTGVDFPTDAPGVVPDEEWKLARYGTKWYPGDLAQMSLGQGMLLVTPLQLACVAGALGTGRLVTPHFNFDMPSRAFPLDFRRRDLDVVREGMRRVVADGTGRLAGKGVDARIIGKTGTAEVGEGARRRKNTWFIAYAEPTGTSRGRSPVALALLVENGESGGGTAAPKVCEILKSFYGEVPL